MNKQKNSHISYKKIIALSILFIVILGISVLAGNVKVNSVKIRFSNNHEITVLTSKTKVSEILEENNILLKDNERVTPKLSEELTEGRTIVITDKSEKSAKADTSKTESVKADEEKKEESTQTNSEENK